MTDSGVRAPRQPVAIIGGGLAGLAAAVALSDDEIPVTLYEMKRQLGGRAASFEDRPSGQWVDHCQHVSMGCCVNYRDFCRRTGMDSYFRHLRKLQFFDKRGNRFALAASAGFPAPFHLAPSLLGMGFLSVSDRLKLLRSLFRLIRLPEDRARELTMQQWLEQQRQSPSAIRRFWHTILVSALSESLDRMSVAYGRKVFLDAFFASRDGYVVEVPAVPLRDLYERVEQWLTARGALIRMGSRVRSLAMDRGRVAGVRLDGGRTEPCQAAIVAVPWQRLGELVNDASPELQRIGAKAAGLESAPIASVHLWTDRPLGRWDHAIVLDRLAQWIFARVERRASEESAAGSYYYQVVISASRSLIGCFPESVTSRVMEDVTSVWPSAGDARWLRSKFVVQKEAVFSPLPRVDSLRPDQQTDVDNLFLAGDWTRTGWPATMESAVRSGYRAAELIEQRMGRRQSHVIPEPRSPWARRLVGSAPNDHRATAWVMG